MLQNENKLKKRILVAPLNWGLGHATRCIPIINALLINGYEPIIASDGAALALLQKEFQKVTSIELPSYNITYPKNGRHFKLKTLVKVPQLVQTITKEKKATNTIVKTYHIDGIISDNRFGVYQNHIPCVYITHQLQVLSGNTTWLSTVLHQKTIERFSECWVPDSPETINLSGDLGHKSLPKIPVKYIGPLSRFQKKIQPIKYDVMVLLSGPEPQRSYLEIKLLEDFCSFKGKVIFIKGVIEGKQYISKLKNITIYNFMTSLQLEHTLNSSRLVVSRSGYTTVMDLAKLNKNAFFIPTPGQYEQEYLAKRLKKSQLVDSCKQKEFSIEKLNSTKRYKGLSSLNKDINFKHLFDLF